MRVSWLLGIVTGVGIAALLPAMFAQPDAVSVRTYPQIQFKVGNRVDLSEISQSDGGGAFWVVVLPDCNSCLVSGVKPEAWTFLKGRARAIAVTQTPLGEVDPDLRESVDSVARMTNERLFLEDRHFHAAPYALKVSPGGLIQEVLDL